jgi:hypothetical protein
MALILLIAAMMAAEGIGAERNLSRSLERRKPRGWEQAVLDQLFRGSP